MKKLYFLISLFLVFTFIGCDRGWFEEQTYFNYSNRGYHNFQSGNYEKAAYYYNKALKMGRVRNFPGYKTHYQDLIDTYQKIIELEPNNADAYYNLGLNKAKLGKYMEARQDFNKALELETDLNKKDIIQEAIKDPQNAKEFKQKNTFQWIIFIIGICLCVFFSIFAICCVWL